MTVRTDDGYVIEAPVVGLSVRVDDDYSASDIYSVSEAHSIYSTPQKVVFEAELAPGGQYTIKDIGRDMWRTLAVKGTTTYKDRSALGVPPQASVHYDEENDLTTFTWSDRVVLEVEEEDEVDYRYY